MMRTVGKYSHGVYDGNRVCQGQTYPIFSKDKLERIVFIFGNVKKIG